MNVASVISNIRKGGPVYTVYKIVKGVFDDRSHADELYCELIPLLHDYLMQGRRFNDPQIQHIVNILRELPADGARRRNFEKRYLQDEYGLRDLPTDPRKIPYGFWH
ncbi:hypothetical protein [Vibrio mangrovi]|uniref:Uncharacterized protein n=1 Tax=Vibrio mangrovi TaxID=474394 RepID=A0A1Y6J2G9_9VIBR|nr:hypothetical protein [Vibrio mangrovi]MDW6005267.1 hypothetical protein [Vibrio mangrovi]SMS02892.1 hypothetical protein VIM7927_04241 [Vibrio mangrovi]